MGTLTVPTDVEDVDEVLAAKTHGKSLAPDVSNLTGNALSTPQRACASAPTCHSAPGKMKQGNEANKENVPPRDENLEDVGVINTGSHSTC